MKKILLSFFLITMLFHFSKAQELFDQNSITLIEITFQESNWDDILQGYFTSGSNNRLMAEVEINGENFDSVGVRYRGGGTFDSAYGKNPFNIKLDYLKNQNFNGTETLKLNNGDKDPSFIREVLSYEIASQFMEAPRANYAKVYVNGSYHGLYVNVESVDKNFMSNRFFSNKDNSFFNCSPNFDIPPTSPPFGCDLGNFSSLEYLGESPLCYFEYYEIESDEGWNDLKELTKTIEQTPNDIESELDIDRFIWMSAYNNVLVNLDSYLGAETKNYYLFKDDNGRFNSLVWDLNESFGGEQFLEAMGNDLTLSEMQELDPLLRTGDATRPLLSLILGNPTYKRQYMAHYRTIYNEVISSGWYTTRANELISLISADVSADPNKIYTTAEFNANLNSTVAINSGGSPFEIPGLTELMSGRSSFLASNAEFVKVGPSITDIVHSPSNIAPNSTASLTAMVSGADYVYVGYRSNVTGIFQKLEMFDDGSHNDGAAGDGVYGNSILVGIEGLQYYIYAESSTSDAGMFSPQKAEFEFHTLIPTIDLVINEFMASNVSTQPDQNGEYDDWIELYNNTSSAINLDGYYLSDDPLNLTKYQFPNVSIDGNGYIIIWADDDETQQGLHAPFKLSAGGEGLYLSNPNEDILDQIVFGGQETDRSTGRYPNGIGPFVDMPGTFNAQNSIETSVYDLANELGLKMYPNPTSEILVIELNNNDFTDILELDLFDIFGKKIKTISVGEKVIVDVSDLKSGIYYLTHENKFLGKVVISK